MSSFIYIAKGNKGRITSKYGYRIHPVTKKRKFHYGLDISHPTGTDILAMSDGVITDSAMRNDACGGTIKVDHGIIDGKKIETRFCHSSQLLKKVGDKVRQGDVIAKSGGGKNDPGRGRSTGPHIHFEVKVDGKSVDPTPYYNGTVTYVRKSEPKPVQKPTQKPVTTQTTDDELPTPDSDEDEEMTTQDQDKKSSENRLDIFGGKLNPIMKGFEKIFSQFGMKPIVKEEIERIKQLMK